MTKRCNVENCTCRDARVINHRYARFVSASRPDAVPFRDPSTLTFVSIPQEEIVDDDAIARRLAMIAAGTL